MSSCSELVRVSVPWARTPAVPRSRYPMDWAHDGGWLGIFGEKWKGERGRCWRYPWRGDVAPWNFLFNEAKRCSPFCHLLAVCISTSAGCVGRLDFFFILLRLSLGFFSPTELRSPRGISQLRKRWEGGKVEIRTGNNLPPPRRLTALIWMVRRGSESLEGWEKQKERRRTKKNSMA